MAYNRYNFLLKVKEICETYQHYRSQGVTTAFIYETYIAPMFYISRATLFNYLNINYKKELEQIEQKKKQTN